MYVCHVHSLLSIMCVSAMYLINQCYFCVCKVCIYLFLFIFLFKKPVDDGVMCKYLLYRQSSSFAVCCGEMWWRLTLAVY